MCCLENLLFWWFVSSKGSLFWSFDILKPYMKDSESLLFQSLTIKIHYSEGLLLKPHMLDICRHISATDGDTQMQFLNHSEVKFECVRIPRFRTWVRHWSLHKKIWISHWPIPNVQPPSHNQSLRQLLCGCVGEHQIASGVWLVCQTTSVCNNPIACTAQILARAFLRTYAPM